MADLCSSQDSLANKEQLAISRQHHWFTIEAMTKTDDRMLAQLCVDHFRPGEISDLRKVERANPLRALRDLIAASPRPIAFFGSPLRDRQ